MSVRPTVLLIAVSFVMDVVALAPQIFAQASDFKLDRTVLPILEPNYPHETELDGGRPHRRHVSK